MKPISYNISSVVGRVAALAFYTVRHPFKFGIKTLIPGTINDIGDGIANGWNSVDVVTVVKVKTETMEDVDVEYKTT